MDKSTAYGRLDCEYLIEDDDFLYCEAKGDYLIPACDEKCKFYKSYKEKEKE